MAQVRWSLRAAGDLQAIEDYVARDSPLYAVRLVDRLVGATERLELFPQSGRVLSEFQRDDLRELIFSGYRIVYLSTPEGVTILRLVHSARDFRDIG